MIKSNPEGPVNRHKAMAMGEQITAKKKGGLAKKAKGGMCRKKGGLARKEGVKS